MRLQVVVLSALLGIGVSAFSAEELSVAVATNFAVPMEKLATAFSQESGYRVVTSLGSTGRLYAQIKNGAPYEVFLSADQETPKKLLQEREIVPGSVFTYAIGRLVLWSLAENGVDPDGEVLKRGGFKHLAIANPKLAPYGRAAREVLVNTGLWQKSQSRLVVGESVAQAYQFVATSNAALGFVALSQVMQGGTFSKGSFWLVPRSLHSPLGQDAALLRKGKGKMGATRFLDFLKTEKAASIMKEYGYESP